MSDIDLEELRLGGIPINCKAADEIERLRSLLKEAGEALERLTTYATDPFDPFEAPDSNDWADAWDQSRTVLHKITGDA